MVGHGPILDVRRGSAGCFPTRPLGRRGEAAAARYLRRRGYQILARGDRLRPGELDLVALRRPHDRLRRGQDPAVADAGHPSEAVDAAKQRRLTRLAVTFLKRHGLLEYPARFDVVAVTWPEGQRRPTIEHIQNAFEAVGTVGVLFVNRPSLGRGRCRHRRSWTECKRVQGDAPSCIWPQYNALAAVCGRTGLTNGPPFSRMDKANFPSNRCVRCVPAVKNEAPPGRHCRATQQRHPTARQRRVFGPHGKYSWPHPHATKRRPTPRTPQCTKTVLCPPNLNQNLDTDIPAPQYKKEQFVQGMKAGIAHGIVPSVNLEIYQDVGVGEASLEYMKAVKAGTQQINR